MSLKRLPKHGCALTKAISLELPEELGVTVSFLSPEMIPCFYNFVGGALYLVVLSETCIFPELLKSYELLALTHLQGHVSGWRK